MRSSTDNIKSFLIETLQRKHCVNLFANYFARIEENYAKSSMLHKFPDFICAYLTIYTNGKDLTPEDTYIYFRDFYNYAVKMKTDENILKHIYRYSNYYLKILTLDVSDVDIRNLLSKINQLGAEDTYSYLMEVFEDYEFAHINKNMFLDILETVLEYASERKFSHKKPLPFSALSYELNKMLAMKDYVPDLEEEALQLKNSASPTINDLINKV